MALPGPKALGAALASMRFKPGRGIVETVVHEAVNETLKLESALAKLRTPQRIVLLHYAPIQATVEGEPPEIFAFVGLAVWKSRSTVIRCMPCFMVMPIVALLKSQKSGVAVYNVALPLLRQIFPEHPPFRLMEIATTQADVVPSPQTLTPVELSS